MPDELNQGWIAVNANDTRMAASLLITEAGGVTGRVIPVDA